MGERGSIRVLLEQRDALAAHRRAERKALYDACLDYFRRRYSCGGASAEYLRAHGGDHD